MLGSREREGGLMSASTDAGATSPEALGPVDAIVIGYPPDAPMRGDAVPLLLDLVDRGIVRVLDVMFLTKRTDGTVETFGASDLAARGVGDLEAFQGASSGLLGDEDVAIVAETIEPGSAAVILVYENRWAAPFAAAVRRNGGQVLATAHIGVEDLLTALDAAESAD
jgi:Family of unknown function (DUF6325)